MNDSGPIADIPTALPIPHRRWSLPLVWLIPLVAAAIGGWLAVKAILEHGPEISISFQTAEGLEAGKTKIKYKNVDIGQVKGIRLAENHDRVILSAEMVKGAEDFLREDTKFWVVRPHVTPSKISGLSTLISGSYIGMEIGTSNKKSHDFMGREMPPIVTSDAPGRYFILHAQDLGSLAIGTPLYFRRFEVGQVVGYQLDEDGKGVSINIFVEAPHDRYVTEDTRFWNASGINLNLDANGLNLNTESLVSILLGGIAFENPLESSTLPTAAENTAFALFSSRQQAMQRPDTQSESFVLVFRESVRGLSPGAPVELRGVNVGEVVSIGFDFDEVRKEYAIPVEIRVYPERVRSRYRQPQRRPAQADTRVAIDEMVAQGLRAQLRTGSLLTGQLYIGLDYFPNETKATLDWSNKPVGFPTVPGAFQELQASLASIAGKLDNFPFDTLGKDLHQSLTSLDATLKEAGKLARRLDEELAPAAKAVLVETRQAMARASTTMGSAEQSLARAGQTLDPGSTLVVELRATLNEIGRTARAIRELADVLERHPEALIRGRTGESP